MEVLRIENIKKTFPLKRKRGDSLLGKREHLVALNDLSFSLKEGEIYGLLGPNGAGKTTALRIISSLIKQESGIIFFQGEDIRKDLSNYRRNIGFLTSELRLDGFFTPNQTFDFFANLYSLKEEEAKREKELLFHRFHIEEYKDKKIENLSTGMKQKCSLALSLAHNPKIILFDEPTNGLDLVASKEVEEYLCELRKQGKSVILSTHIFSLAEKLCDRIGILLKGNLVKEGEKKTYQEEGGLEKVFFSLYQEDES